MKHVSKLLVALCVSAVVWFGCDLLLEKGSKDNSQPATSSTKTIGPEGGSIETENGAKIVFPAGALSQPTSITIKSYPSNETLPGSWSPMPGMAGALGCSPDQLSFLVPVEITMPLDSSWTAGQQLSLFHFNTATRMWDQTSNSGTIGANGRTLTTTVNHFSGYGGGSVNGLLSGGSIDQFVSDFSEWYRSNVLDLGSIKVKDNECFELVGMAFDLQYKSNATVGSDFWRVGRTSQYTDPPLVLVDYTYDISNGHDVDGYLRITVTNYYDCTKPMLLLRSDRSVLKEGETTTVYADLSCAGTGLYGKEITFDIQSGPGEVNPGNTTTNSSGTASTTFTAGDEYAVVRGFYTSCPMGDSQVLQRTLPIAVVPDQFNLHVSYDQTMNQEDYSHSMSYSGNVTISVTGDNGDGSANVQGSASFPLSGGGTAGDCTMTTSGLVDFSLTGTLVTDSGGSQTLNLSQNVNFSYTTTTVCPDFPPFSNQVNAGESAEYTMPVENGYTIDETKSFQGTTNHIVYVLTF